MNTDQNLVKMHLDPMFAICDFLKDFFNERIKYTQEHTSFRLSPNMQEDRLTILNTAYANFNVIYNEIKVFKQELLDCPALEQFSLDSVRPGFINKVQNLRGELMQLITV